MATSQAAIARITTTVLNALRSAGVQVKSTGATTVDAKDPATGENVRVTVGDGSTSTGAEHTT